MSALIPGGWVARILLAGVFLFAGVLKVSEPARFATDIANYHLLPWSVGVGLAFYLPWVEILSALGLFLARFRKGASAIIFASLVLFIAATIAAKVRGIDLTCGCFGHAGRNLSFVTHLSLDLLLLALALFLLWLPERSTGR